MPKIWSDKKNLLCGVLLLVTTPLCHAQESARLFDVNIPQTRMSSASAPNITRSLPSHTEKSKPDKGVAEKSWFRRFLEGIAIGTARFNTEKQDEGRPQPANNSR